VANAGVIGCSVRHVVKGYYMYNGIVVTKVTGNTTNLAKFDERTCFARKSAEKTCEASRLQLAKVRSLTINMARACSTSIN
jgi:hypothetical protein